MIGKTQKYSIIFDLDGTLVDSEKTWHTAMDVFLHELGFAGKGSEINYQLVGLTEQDSMKKIIDHFKLSQKPEDLIELRLDIVRNLHMRQTEIFTGSKELLIETEREGFKTALATASERSLADLLLAKHGIRSYFDVVLTAQDVKKGKPNPEVFLRAAEVMCVNPEQCIVIEDSPRGLEAARAAGMKSIAVKHDGIFSDEELLSKNPIRLVNGIHELTVDDFLELS